MKTQNILLLLLSAIFVCGCTSNQASSKDATSEEKSFQSSSSSSHSSSSSTSQSTKVTVAAHTLKDTNPPVDIYEAEGQQVSESTWNSFLNGAKSKFNGHYNYKYTAYYSASNYQQRFFTKNGYAINSLTGSTYSAMYYERKGSSGNTFYQYISVSDGYLRQETSFNLTDTFTSLFVEHINDNHMFAQNLYSWNESNECYIYQISSTASSMVKFQGGYLTNLTYRVDGMMFSIDTMFDTTIDIPKSYYYA